MLLGLIPSGVHVEIMGKHMYHVHDKAEIS